MQHSSEDWYRALMACGVKPSVAIQWAQNFALAVQPDRFSKGETEIPQWLAQILHESGMLTKTEESLNYSAERLMVVWPTRFPTCAEAQRFEHNSEALANKVYGGRLGNTAPDDGWKYRGRGLIQVTGKANYAALGKLMGRDFVKNPDQLSERTTALETAVLWWEGNVPDSILGDNVRVRRKVNGGTTGLAETNKLAALAEKAMNT